MLNIALGNTDRFLADVDRAQEQMQQLQAQMSSGIRLQKPSDDPAVLDEVGLLQGQLGLNQQIQANIGSAKALVDASDDAVQSSIKLVENAISFGMQGGSAATTPEQRLILATQVQGLLETLVGISQTNVNGRYVFSGDQDTTASYQLDPTQATGVRRLLTPESTIAIQDGNGTRISLAKTAGEIFDLRNPDDTPATTNAFAALNALRTALAANDSTGIAQAVSALKEVDQHINLIGTFYGNAQARLASATALAQKFQVSQRARLGDLRDTDITSAALQLTQAQTQLQAALASESKVSRNNLFDFLT